MEKKRLNGWQTVCNIVNAFTNQLYLADEANPGCVKVDRAHVSNNSIGGRSYEADEGADIIVVGVKGFTWDSLGENGIRRIYLESGKSGSKLIITREVDGWYVEYQSGTDPSYEGAYWFVYSNANSVDELNMEYVTQYSEPTQVATPVPPNSPSNTTKTEDRGTVTLTLHDTGEEVILEA